MLQLKTIEPGTLQLLRELQSLPMMQDTRLVGGTALALQLGHRRSVDLDFFGTVETISEDIRTTLSESHKVTILKESKNINIYLVDDVKVDIVNYSYSWLSEPVLEEGLRLASAEDIAAMKISAIEGRGTKKDFIDLYFLLNQYSLQEILDLYMRKYQEGSLFVAMKSLSFFEDAEQDPMPLMFENVSWEQIKERIRKELSIL